MSDINEMLLEFASRFRLDGDLLRCIDCNRGIVASRMDEDFVHAPSCKSRRIGGRPWAALQGILAGPLVDMMKSATAELAAVKAERDQLQSQRDELHARLYPEPCKGCPGCSSYADCPDRIDKMTADRDATEAALREFCDGLRESIRMAAKHGPATAEEAISDACDIQFRDNLKAAGLWREPTGGES